MLRGKIVANRSGQKEMKKRMKCNDQNIMYIIYLFLSDFLVPFIANTIVIIVILCRAFFAVAFTIVCDSHLVLLSTFISISSFRFFSSFKFLWIFAMCKSIFAKQIEKKKKRNDGMKGGKRTYIDRDVR